MSSYCDFNIDCDEGEDEIDCVIRECTEEEWKCDNRECISHSLRCNLVTDCADGSDENLCGKGWSSLHSHFTISSTHLNDHFNS